jgi:S1-C subfamily serine protease
MRCPWTNRKRVVLWVVALALCLGSARPATTLYSQLLLSTGWVVIPTPQSHKSTDGTCEVIDTDRRLALTCAHVVGTSSQVSVYFPLYGRDGTVLTDAAEYPRYEKPIRAQVIAKDAKSDLALLRLDSLPTGVRALSLAASPAKKGERVHSVGNGHPAGKKLQEVVLWRYHEGTVESVGFRVDKRRAEDKQPAHQVEAREVQARLQIIHGDSGSPLVDDNGRLVGVVSGFNEKTGLDFAIDVNEIRIFLQRANGMHPGEVPGKPIVGRWTVVYHKDGQTRDYGLTLNEDGTCLFENAQRDIPGHYTYRDNLLSLNLPELKSRLRVKVDWNGHDTFRFTDSKGVQHTVDRR